MDEAYNSVFETLFSEFPTTYGKYHSGLEGIPGDEVLSNLRMVRNRITLEVNSSKYKRIRPDAKLFLINNYYHMVLLPVLLYTDGKNKKYPLNENFNSQVNNDIAMILSAANQLPSDEITGHSIITAINTRWNDLFTTVKMSWSSSEDY